MIQDTVWTSTLGAPFGLVEGKGPGYLQDLSSPRANATSGEWLCQNGGSMMV